MSTAERVVVTGLGAVSALGLGVDALFEGALGGRSGVHSWPEAASPWIAAAVPGDADGFGANQLPAQVDRHVGLASLAVREALADADLTAAAAGSTTGIYWGTGVGSAATLEQSYSRLHAGQRTRPLTILLAMQNAAVAQIALDQGLRGPQMSVSQACASAAVAIGEAMLALRWGRAERVVVGGSEAPLVEGQLLAWDALRVLAKKDTLAPEHSCRPFDRRRSGLVLGEGAAALVLERESVARRRGARIYAELCGYGNAGDASHYARPDPAGQQRAMELALQDAGLTPSDIGYINAHATATTVGDAAEAAAIRNTFGERPPAVSSTKAVHGHTLGASGALELAITVLALVRGECPPTAHLGDTDAEGLDLISGAPRRAGMHAALSNTFAFGGSNVSLAVRQYQAAA